ncbi:outer membrane beta-barrel protein [Helicobacter suis]|uniref:outer membrane beta-barrel protein n=1 Tax=Helicobacter suis TaxID=104628 RepID=UPI0013CF8610|nr:outer membrane beta-barrel protein [Helicobacter suis]
MFKKFLVFCLLLIEGRGGKLGAADIRNGFFFGAEFGVQSQALQSTSMLACPNCGLIKAEPSGYSSSITNLTKGINEDIKEALSQLQNLQNLINATKDKSQNISDLTPLNLSSISELGALEQEISNDIARLARNLNLYPKSKQNQEVLSTYNQLLSQIKNLDKQLISEVNSYNNQLKNSKETYDQDKADYQNTLNNYNTNIKNYTNDRNSLVPNINSASSASSVATSAQSIINDLKTITSLDKSLSSQYNQYSNEGIDDAKAVADVLTQALQGGSQQAQNFLNGLLEAIDSNLPNTNFDQLIAVVNWFAQMAKEIQKQCPQYESDLLAVYKTAFSDIGVTGTSFIPTAKEVFGNPPAKPSPPNLKFNYQNFNQQITSLQTVHPSLESMIQSIYSAQRFFQNMSYNAGILLGWQSFFSKHFGYSTYSDLGYSYVNSPLLKNDLSVFKSLQNVSIDLGANLIFDFNTPKNNSTPVFYGIFAGVQGGSTNWVLTGPVESWRASYNVDIDFGLRLQFNTNIIKWGVDIPVVPHEINWQSGFNHLELDNSAKDIGFFITYEKLFMHRASGYWYIVRHKRYNSPHISKHSIYPAYPTYPIFKTKRQKSHTKKRYLCWPINGSINALPKPK